MDSKVNVNYEELAESITYIEEVVGKTYTQVAADAKCGEHLSDSWESRAKSKFEELHQFLTEDVGIEYSKIENAMDILVDMMLSREEIDKSGTAAAGKVASDRK